MWFDILFMNARRMIFSIADFNSVRVVNELNADLSFTSTCYIKLVTRL